MSLVVWLPLTKDLRQQGLSGVSAINSNGSYSSTGGKLGGCYSFTNGYINCGWGNGINSKNISVAFWCKPNASLNDAMVFGCLNGSNQRLYIGVKSNTYNISYGTYTWGRTSNAPATVGVWSHICLTVDFNGVVKLYQNGVLTNETTTYTTAFTFPSNFMVGGRSDGYRGNCSINDVRIYDHCLSLMEVKELAKGLVLHYPLNRGGFGQENLFSQKYWTYSTSGWTGNVISSVAGSTIKPIINSDGSCILTGAGSSGNSQCYLYNSNHRVNLTANKTYTISVLVTSTNISKFRFWWYDYDSSGNKLATSATDIFTINNGETKLLSYTRTLSENTTSCYWELNMYAADTSATLLLHAHSLKLEEGSIATSWCPNLSDALATTMGLNSTTEYDCSGFCNNGTRTGTFTWTSDTPKYQVSTQFNGTQIIRLPFSCGTISEAITIACWGYESNWNTSSAERLIGAATSSSGWCIGDYGSENTLFAFYANGGYNVATGFKQLVAGWHHFVITFDGLNLKYYVDGQQFSSKTFSTKQVAIGNYNIEIGRHYGDGCNFKGRMSDVRIYATALSADDVKSLYQNCATIDPDGTIRGQIRS